MLACQRHCCLALLPIDTKRDACFNYMCVKGMNVVCKPGGGGGGGVESGDDLGVACNGGGGAE